MGILDVAKANTDPSGGDRSQLGYYDTGGNKISFSDISQKATPAQANVFQQALNNAQQQSQQQNQQQYQQPSYQEAINNLLNPRSNQEIAEEQKIEEAKNNPKITSLVENLSNEDKLKAINAYDQINNFGTPNGEITASFTADNNPYKGGILEDLSKDALNNPEDFKGGALDWMIKTWGEEEEEEENNNKDEIKNPESYELQNWSDIVSPEAIGQSNYADLFATTDDQSVRDNIGANYGAMSLASLAALAAGAGGIGLTEAGLPFIPMAGETIDIPLTGLAAEGNPMALAEIAEMAKTVGPMSGTAGLLQAIESSANPIATTIDNAAIPLLMGSGLAVGGLGAATLDESLNLPDESADEQVDKNNPWLPNGMPNTAKNRAALEEAKLHDAQRENSALNQILNGKQPYTGDSDLDEVYYNTVTPILNEVLKQDEKSSNKDKANFDDLYQIKNRIIENANTYDWANDQGLGQRRMDLSKGLNGANKYGNIEYNRENGRRELNDDEGLANTIANNILNDMYNDEGQYLTSTRAAPQSYNQMDRFNYYIQNTPAGYDWAIDIDPALVADDPEAIDAFTNYRMLTKDLTDKNATGSWDDAMDRLWTDIWNDTSDLTKDELKDYKLLTRDENGKLDKTSRNLANEWMYTPANQFDLEEYLNNPEEYSKTPEYLNLGKQANAVLDFTNLVADMGFRPYELTNEDLLKINRSLKNKYGDQVQEFTNESLSNEDIAMYNLIGLMQRGAEFSDEDINKLLEVTGEDVRVTRDKSGLDAFKSGRNHSLPLLTPRGDSTYYMPYVYDTAERKEVNPRFSDRVLDTLLSYGADDDLGQLLIENPNVSKQKDKINTKESLAGKNWEDLTDREKYELMLAFNNIGQTAPLSY